MRMTQGVTQHIYLVKEFYKFIPVEKEFDFKNDNLST